MKNIRVKVIESCGGHLWWFSICDGKKELMRSTHWNYWKTKAAAIRNAKAMAKRLIIKYDPEIIRQHGC